MGHTPLSFLRKVGSRVRRLQRGGDVLRPAKGSDAVGDASGDELVAGGGSGMCDEVVECEQREDHQDGQERTDVTALLRRFQRFLEVAVDEPGQAFLGPLNGSAFSAGDPNEVNSRGAVSPTTLAMPRKIAVATPLRAVGSTTDHTVPLPNASRVVTEGADSEVAEACHGSRVAVKVSPEACRAVRVRIWCHSFRRCLPRCSVADTKLAPGPEQLPVRYLLARRTRVA
ncbi:hypothetical protein [Amycolatopsis sp.]|uniref:hypothetical protein n=1 Tax=Amycolatopsis sp. TaxID=37632 RepID=UPI0039C8A378